MKLYTLILIIIALISVISFSLQAAKTEKDTSVKKITIKKEQPTKLEKETPAKITNEIPASKIEKLTEQLINHQPVPVTTSPQAGEQIKWQVISSGGLTGVSANFVLSGTIGQTAVGIGTSTNYIVNSGFWQDFDLTPSGCCVDIRGNVDSDSSDQIDIADLVYFVAYSFSGGPAPVCFEEADMDASLTLDIGDIVYLVAYSFSGGPPPLAC